MVTATKPTNAEREAFRVIESKAYIQFDNERFCHYCGITQNHETPDHADDCPIEVLRQLIR